jgi:4-hydroxythreonine-4-phosphate dehydrogenase
MKLFKKIALTTGDKNGVGFEVAVKALTHPKFKKNKNVLIFLFRHISQEKKQAPLFRLIDKHWLRLTFSNLEQALIFVNTKKNFWPKNLLIDLALLDSEAQWVVTAAHACKNKSLDALVTGPLSKKITSDLPQNVLGHTGIFRHMFPKRNLFMSFIGKDFNVLLATDHIPLADVQPQLLKSGLKPVLGAAHSLQSLLKSKKKIAILGLNPHAGEKGLIGSTEKLLFKKLSKNIEGPLVPDAAFLKKNWKKYSLFVALYHDQGLIPFKMHHGQDSGVHVTLGLPFVRTSVDHGTAFDLFNKNLANPNSMLEAINLAIKLTGV